MSPSVPSSPAQESDLILREKHRVPAYFASLNGQPKFYSLCSLLIESAATHAALHGFGYHEMLKYKQYWVLSRFHVRMHAYPGIHENIIVETWPRGPDKLFFIRDYRIVDPAGRLLTTATSAWLVLDAESGRPQKPVEVDRVRDFKVNHRHAIETVPDKLPPVSDPDQLHSVITRYSDLDINQHVNALKYIEWIQDLYDADLYVRQNVCEFQINYQVETRFGEHIEIRARNTQPEDPYDYLEGIRDRDQKTVFRARIRFDDYQPA